MLAASGGGSAPKVATAPAPKAAPTPAYNPVSAFSSPTLTQQLSGSNAAPVYTPAPAKSATPQGPVVAPTVSSSQQFSPAPSIAKATAVAKTATANKQAAIINAQKQQAPTAQQISQAQSRAGGGYTYSGPVATPSTPRTKDTFLTKTVKNVTKDIIGAPSQFVHSLQGGMAAGAISEAGATPPKSLTTPLPKDVAVKNTIQAAKELSGASAAARLATGKSGGKLGTALDIASVVPGVGAAGKVIKEAGVVSKTLKGASAATQAISKGASAAKEVAGTAAKATAAKVPGIAAKQAIKEATSITKEAAFTPKNVVSEAQKITQGIGGEGTGSAVAQAEKITGKAGAAKSAQFRKEQAAATVAENIARSAAKGGGNLGSTEQRVVKAAEDITKKAAKEPPIGGVGGGGARRPSGPRGPIGGGGGAATSGGATVTEAPSSVSTLTKGVESTSSVDTSQQFKNLFSPKSQLKITPPKTDLPGAPGYPKAAPKPSTSLPGAPGYTKTMPKAPTTAPGYKVPSRSTTIGDRPSTTAAPAKDTFIPKTATTTPPKAPTPPKSTATAAGAASASAAGKSARPSAAVTGMAVGAAGRAATGIKKSKQQAPSAEGTFTPTTGPRNVQGPVSTSVDASKIKTPNDFSNALLNKLGIPASKGSVEALNTWSAYEGGHWKNSAQFNPLNTTLKTKGATGSMNKVGVQGYKDWGSGVDAIAQTLTGAGAKERGYTDVVDALKSGDKEKALNAINQSAWRTGKTGGAGSYNFSGDASSYGTTTKRSTEGGLKSDKKKESLTGTGLSADISTSKMNKLDAEEKTRLGLPPKTEIPTTPVESPTTVTTTTTEATPVTKRLPKTEVPKDTTTKVKETAPRRRRMRIRGQVKPAYTFRPSSIV